MNGNQRSYAKPHSNRLQLALLMIRLGDNMRLRADLGEPATTEQAAFLNSVVHDYDRSRRNVPRQRKAAEK